MEQVFTITGMTCNGCRTAVENKLKAVDGVLKASVLLEKEEATLETSEVISLTTLREALPEKYSISPKKDDTPVAIPKPKSKLQQLKPLLIILFYIAVSSNLLHYKNWMLEEVMLDFMGLFFIVFSFFKILDLKGFPESFRMYDPLAKVLPVYGWIYPFIEIALGLLFLMRFQLTFALIATLIVLGITTIGVTKTLLNKKSINCACLGTALKLPMTEATFIENTIMIIMAALMLGQVF